MKDMRIDKRLSQKEVAILMNVSRSTVAKWELGIAFPRPETAEKLADLYGCTIDQLYQAWKQSASA